MREIASVTDLKNEEKQQIKDSIAEKESLENEATQQLQIMVAEFQVLREKIMEFDRQKDDYKEKLDVLDAKIESSKRRLNGHLEAQQNCEEAFQRKQAEIEAATVEANSAGPRVTSNRHKTQIQRDIDKQRGSIQVRVKY